jgi:hypothetical protein
MSADRCTRCGRRITNPESVVHGMGPVCFTKYVQSAQTSLFDDAEVITAPFQHLPGVIPDQISTLVGLLTAARAKLTDAALCKRIDKFLNK